ncbi:Tetratricopeptide TPR-1 domain containing protein [Aphelenchoides besseyi]|nr:Tetratricopeptide TPR-1 domain containing protein [Aphelenchoides besseyi]KAI6211577.1 Tetratricopeptide TPR-1 domain containing protein [Aphelenchoides besseyi]
MASTNPDQEKNTTAEEVTRKINRDEQNLTVAFIQFLRQKVSVNDCNPDQAEAIEVAVQCLESAFNLSDKNYAYQPAKPLLETFKSVEGVSSSEDEFPNPTATDIEQANKLKEEGNELVKASKFHEAVEKYNAAIKLNRDPIYFCNRAAAYCRLEQHDLAIQDCRTALALDPNYAKAYGRMGVALSCQNRYDQAVEAYKRAVELDPTNESYKNNMSIAEEKMREAEQSSTGAAGGFPGLGALGGLGGLGGMLNNPQMAQMAAQMMSDPNIQNMMGQMMNAFGGSGQAPGSAGSGPSFDGLMRVGEQIAETLQQSNPELVEQLRQQFNSTRGPSSGSDGADGNDANRQPPPSS